MTNTETRTVGTDGAEITYDVREPDSPNDRPALLMIGQPMDASGFAALADEFADRTVITYDPRGLGRSTRSDGGDEQWPEVQATDVHAVIEAMGLAPVDLFASSGGAVTALELVAEFPDDVQTLVAHEPPMVRVLPDAEAAARARDAYLDAYAAHGFGAGMAGFLVMSGWQGEYTEAYASQPAPDPAQFGLPTSDDGGREDPLLSRASLAITEYQPDVDALKAAATRIVLGLGEETGDAFTEWAARATAELLDAEAVVFPSHHGGFVGGDNQWAGKPKEFGVTLHEVLD